MADPRTNTGKLSADARADGFAGLSGAWFDRERVLAFAYELHSFPLPEAGVALSGGLGMDRDYQETLGLRVRPVGARGQVGVRVTLETERWTEQPVEPNSSTFEVLTTYQRLERFATHLRMAVEGKVEDAVLGVEKFGGDSS